MLRHLRRTAFAAAVATLLAGGAHADPQVVKGLIGSPQAGAQVFKQDESFESRELDGGALLRVAPGTEISPLYTTRLVLSGGRKTPTHVFRVGEGRVDVTIPPDKAERVAVLLVGPGGNSAVVHQGRSIVVAKHDAMSFTALDRSMLTGKGSTWKRLTAGGSRVIDLKRGSSEETAALAAPDVGVLQPLRIVLPGEGFQTEVKLHQVEGAERYQVALLKRNGSQLEYVKQVESRGPTLTLSGSEPGHYAVVARALDRFGVPGHVSRPESFRVLSVALPPGSHAEQGSVFVPPNRRVQLVAADGLQMTYGAGAHFVPAPDSVAMSRGTAFRKARRSSERANGGALRSIATSRAPLSHEACR